MVGPEKEAADLAIINRTGKGDLVVTQDWGQAGLVLAKNAIAISPWGHQFRDDEMMGASHSGRSTHDCGAAECGCRGPNAALRPMMGPLNERTPQSRCIGKASRPAVCAGHGWRLSFTGGCNAPAAIPPRSCARARAVAEALGTEVAWDGQANRVHINGKVDLAGKVYFKTITARVLTDNWGNHNVYYAAIVINATDQTLKGASVLCKAATQEGKIVDATASNLPELPAHASTAVEWHSPTGTIKVDGLTPFCELGTPMG